MSRLRSSSPKTAFSSRWLCSEPVAGIKAGQNTGQRVFDLGNWKSAGAGSNRACSKDVPGAALNGVETVLLPHTLLHPHASVVSGSRMNTASHLLAGVRVALNLLCVHVCGETGDPRPPSGTVEGIVG